MRIKTSYAIAAILALVLVGWLWSGQIGKGSEEPGTVALTDDNAVTSNQPISVQVSDITAEPIEREIIANGKTAPNRIVQMRGETTGRVIATGPAEGSLVKQGDLLVTLDPRDREAAVLEASAILRQREIELEAAKKLNEKGFQAETNVAEAEANYAKAEATLKRANLGLDHTQIRAPIDGILDHRDVEVGDLIDIGDPVATLVDVNPFLITGEVIETEVGKLRNGMRGVARLANGQTVDGTLRYIGSRADEQTRTFSIELEVPNDQEKVALGISAELRITAEILLAHRMPPSLLSLGDDGDLGVMTVNDENEVIFMPVDIARAEEQSVWLTGLPEQVRVITVGQGFVRDGSKVRPALSKEVVSEPVVSEVRP